MTKEKFKAYVNVQYSGKTNMFDVGAVCRLSKGKLTREDCFDIMKKYEIYEAEYFGYVTK